MASVQLQQCYLHNPRDYADFIAFDADSIEEVPTVRGEFRPRANGGVQLVTRAGQHRALTVHVPAASRALVNAFRTRSGKKQLFRDPRGRKLFGAYLEPDIAEIPAVDLANVTFTMREVSHEEAAG